LRRTAGFRLRSAGLPATPPCARAAANPALVRSTISASSNCPVCGAPHTAHWTKPLSRQDLGLAQPLPPIGQGFREPQSYRPRIHQAGVDPPNAAETV
jgi:hypothetical protein